MLGETAIALSVAPWLVISNVAVPFIDPELAVIVLAPIAIPVAIPVAPTEATLALEDVHCTEVVRSLELPSLYLPVAANCWLEPMPIENTAGVTDKDVSEGLPPPPPEAQFPAQPISAFGMVVRADVGAMDHSALCPGSLSP